MDLTYLLLSALAGGATGYVTNDIAVKMIFRKYFGLGGLIVKTREEFRVNVGNMVEDKILNEKTILQEVEKEEFKIVAEKVVRKTLKEFLYEKINNLQVSDINGSTDTLTKIKNLLSSEAKEIIPDVLTMISEKIKLNDLITEKQLATIGNNIAQEIIANVITKNKIPNFLKSLSASQNNLKVKDIVPDSITIKLKKNFKSETKNFNLLLKSHSSDIDSFIESNYKNLSFIATVKDISDNLKQRTLRSFLGDSASKNTAYTIKENLLDLLRREEGQKIVKDLSATLIDELSRINYTIFDLLDKNVQSKFEQMLLAELPTVIAKLLEWLKSQKNDIESMLIELISDSLKSEKGFKAGIKDFFWKMIDQSSFLSKHEVVKKIIDFVRDSSSENVDYLSKEISAKVVEYLKGTKVSELVSILRSKGILTEETICRVLLDNIELYKDKLSDEIMENVLDIKVGSIVPDLHIYLEEIFKRVVAEELKDKFLYSNKSVSFIHHEIDKVIKTKTESSIKSVLTDSNIEFLNNFIVSNKKGISETISKRIQSLVNDKMDNSYFTSLFKKEKLDKLSSYLLKELDSYLSLFISKFEQDKISNLLDKVNKNNDVDKDLTEFGLKELSKNLKNIIKGNISKNVYNNLSEDKMPDQILQKKIENFMGKELKPINWFGAFLGALAGVVTYFTVPEMSWYFNALISVPVYAIIGYGTNWLALKMLFRSWKPFKIPLWQAIIEKNQSRFAAEMGEFISKELMQEESLSTEFKSNKMNFIQYGCDFFKSNKYSTISGFLKNKYEFIAGKIYGKSKEKMLANDNLAEKIAEKIQKIKPVDFIGDTSEIANKFYDFVINEKSDLLEIANVKICEFMQTDKSLSKFVNEETLDNFATEISTEILLKIKNLLSNENLSEVINEFLNSKSHLLNQSVHEIIAENQRKTVFDLVSKFIGGFFTSQDKNRKVIDHIIGYIEKEVSPDKKIKELFNGELIKFVNNNSDLVVSILSETLRTYFKNNSTRISTDIYDKIYEDAFWTSISNVKETIRLGIYNAPAKIDKFLTKKTPELQCLIREVFETSIGNKRVSDIGTFDKDSLQKAIYQIAVSTKLMEIAKKFGVTFADSLMQVKIGNILKVTSIHDLTDLIKIFEEEKRILVYKLSDSMAKNEKNIQNNTQKLISIISKELVDKISIKNLFNEMDNENVNKMLSNIDENILELLETENFIKETIFEIVENLSLKPLNKIIDKKDFKMSLSKIVIKLLENNQVETELKLNVINIARKLSLNFDNIVSKELLEQAVEIVISSLIDSIEENLIDIINALNMKNIAEKEINGLNTKEIEELFYSFAGKYFNKLELYGLFGGVFGIHQTLSPIAIVWPFVERYIPESKSTKEQ